MDECGIAVMSGEGGVCARSEELIKEIFAGSLIQYLILFQYQQRDCLSGWPGKKHVVKLVDVLVGQRVAKGIEE